MIEPIADIQPFYIPQNIVCSHDAQPRVQRQVSETSSVSRTRAPPARTSSATAIDTPVTPGAGNFNDRRLYYGIAPLIQSIIERGSNGVSRYNSMQVKFTHRMSKGLQGLVSYTLAQSKDDTSIFWVWNDAMNYVPNSTDFRHVLTVSWTYDLPFGNGRALLSKAPKALDLVPGGWSLNGITWMRTGSPMSVGVANNLLNTGTGNYANLVLGSIIPSGSSSGSIPAASRIRPRPTPSATQRPAFFVARVS